MNNVVDKEELNWRLRVFDSLSYPTLIIRPDYTLVSAKKYALQGRGLPGGKGFKHPSGPDRDMAEGRTLGGPGFFPDSG
jgi:hypothetical protein